MTSHDLFATMSQELAGDILEFAFTADKALYRAALEAAAQSRKVRPIFLERQPRAERHATMAATLARATLETAADSLIRGWLIKKHPDMLADFLTALQIPHEKGVVEELPKSVDDGVLQQAVNGLLGKYRPETVTLYLHAFNQMNNAQWPNLEELLYTQGNLKLGK